MCLNVLVAIAVCLASQRFLIASKKPSAVTYQPAMQDQRLRSLRLR